MTERFRPMDLIRNREEVRVPTAEARRKLVAYLSDKDEISLDSVVGLFRRWT